MASRQRAPSVSERLDFQGVPHGSEAQLASNEQRQRKPSRAAPRLSVRGVLGAELGQPAAVSDRDESAALRAWDDRRKVDPVSQEQVAPKTKWTQPLNHHLHQWTRSW